MTELLMNRVHNDLAKGEYVVLLNTFVLLSSSEIYRNELQKGEFCKERLNTLLDNLKIKVDEDLIFDEKQNVKTQNIIDELCIYSNTLKGYEKVLLDFILLPLVYKESYRGDKVVFNRNDLMLVFDKYYKIPSFRIIINNYLNAVGILFEDNLLNIEKEVTKYSSHTEKMLCVGHLLWILKYLNINSQDKNKNFVQKYTSVLKKLLNVK